MTADPNDAAEGGTATADAPTTYAPADGGPPPALPAGAPVAVPVQPESRYVPPDLPDVDPARPVPAPNTVTNAAPNTPPAGFNFAAARRANLATKQKRELVPTPEWPDSGALYAHRLPAETVKRVVQASYKVDDAGAAILDEDDEPEIDPDRFGVHLIMAATYAEDGTTRPFNSDEGRAFLSDPDMDAIVFNRLVAAAMDVNGMSKRARQAIRKNSPPRTATSAGF